ncbi:MAG: response regulator, partial [Gemmatimonadales bacterium]
MAVPLTGGPAVEKSAAALPSDGPPDPPAAPVNILLVDDQPANLLALEAMLQGLGQTLLQASSGREALKCLLAHEVAVVLLDVEMPEMDGFETAALIRQRDKSRHTPIIFLTAADTSHTDAVRGYGVGAVDYLVKPVVPEFVISTPLLLLPLMMLRAAAVAPMVLFVAPTASTTPQVLATE